MPGHRVMQVPKKLYKRLVGLSGYPSLPKGLPASYRAFCEVCTINKRWYGDCRVQDPPASRVWTGHGLQVWWGADGRVSAVGLAQPQATLPSPHPQGLYGGTPQKFSSPFPTGDNDATDG